MKTLHVMWRNGAGRTLRAFLSVVIMAILGGCPLPVGQQYPVPEALPREVVGSVVRRVLDYDLQHYVPVPAAGTVAVPGLTRPDLTVTVQWKDAAGEDISAPDPFGLHAVYQAEITLTTESPYIFDMNVPFAYLTAPVKSLDGGNTDTMRRTLTVSYHAAEFPEPLNGIDLAPFIPAPVLGEIPVTEFSAGTYTGTVEWQIGTDPHAGGAFQPDTRYTANLTLTPAQGYVFAQNCSVTHSAGKAGTFSSEPLNNKISGNITFRATDAALLSLFSGDLEDTTSVIDKINEAKDRKSLRLQLTPETEQVELKQGTDIGVDGLILKHVPGDPDLSTSPANLVIDGGDMTIDLTGSPADKPLITVDSGVTLTLRNITIMGLPPAQNSTAPLIQVNNGGKLIMEEGTLITDHHSDGTGGVEVKGGGEFTMDGGEISNASGGWGGGVSVDGDGRFTMNGGTIRDNTAGGAGGVFVRGLFVMNRGTISGNTAWTDGGGVCLNIDGELIMNGGIISGNAAAGHGGGVALKHVNNVFVISGGTIGNNTANENGGGVHIAGGTCVMNYGGVISGNTAGADGSGSGGGVYMDSGAFSIIYGGTIRNNKVNDTNGNGGGVYVGNGGVFTMSLGSISGNGINPGGGSGGGKGCGVYVDSASEFRKTGGTIHGVVGAEGGGWEDGELQNYYRYQVSSDSTYNTSSLPGGQGIGYAVYYADGDYWRDKTAGQGHNLDTNSPSSGDGWGQGSSPNGNY